MKYPVLNNRRRLSFGSAYTTLKQWVRKEFIDFDPYDIEARTEQYIADKFHVRLTDLKKFMN